MEAKEELIETKEQNENTTGINIDYFKSIGFTEQSDGLLEKPGNPYLIELLDYQPTVGQALAVILNGRRVYHGYYHDIVDLNKEFNFGKNG